MGPEGELGGESGARRRPREAPSVHFAASISPLPRRSLTLFSCSMEKPVGARWPGSVPPSVQDWLRGVQVGLDGFVQPWCGEHHFSCLNRRVGLCL